MAAAALAGLAANSFRAKDRCNENLLLAQPYSDAQPGIDENALKDKLESRFPITYECVEDGAVSAIHKNKTAQIAAVNCLYKNVMPYTMASGGFFTEDHQKRAANTAVLNEKAAFDLFGGNEIIGNEIRINGEPYRVLGVIRDDYKDALRVYIPITRVNLRPNTFMIRLDESKGVSAEYAINECKRAGITDTKYEFINLGARAGRIEGAFLFASAILAGVCAAYFLRFVIKTLAGLIRKIRYESRQYYAFSLVLRKPHYFLGLLGLACLAACCCAGFLWLLTQSVNGFLTYDGWNFFAMYTTAGFTERVAFLSSTGIYSDILFIVFTAGVMFWLLSGVKSGNSNRRPFDEQNAMGARHPA